VQCAVWTKSHIIITIPQFFSEHSISIPQFFDVVTRRVLTNAQHLELVSVQIDKTYVVKQ